LRLLRDPPDAGKQRSRTVESIVAEATRLAAEGVKEVNLISQDTVNYGVDLGVRQVSSRCFASW